MPRNKNLTEETNVGLPKAAPAQAPATPAALAIPPEKPEKQEDADLAPRSRGRGGK